MICMICILTAIARHQSALIHLFPSTPLRCVSADNWQKHFHDELDARREDWSTVQSILDREEQQRRDINDDDELPVAAVHSRKRKAAVALSVGMDDSHNPTYSLHYHALSGDVKAALLYLHCCWMLHDHNVHGVIAESALRDMTSTLPSWKRVKWIERLKRTRT